MPVPRGVLAKVRRAVDHSVEFGQALDRYVHSEPYATTHETERGGRVHAFRFRVRNPPPAELSPILGDFLHNARSSLDHVLFALAKMHKPGLSEKEARRIQFPVCNESSEFVSRMSSMPLPEGIKEAVRGFQLFDHSEYVQTSLHYDESGRARVVTRVWRDSEAAKFPLYTLRDLSNVDKHREFPIVAGQVNGEFRYPDNLPPLKFSHGTEEPTDGDLIAQLEFTEPVAADDVGFLPTYSTIIKTESPLHLWTSREATLQLDAILESIVGLVIPRLEPFFD